MLVLDSGGVTRLAERSSRAAALITVLRREGLWPPTLPSVVLVGCLSGRPEKDTLVNRLVKSCDVEVALSEARVRRAAWLRGRAGSGSAVDAVVVAAAEPGGTVLSGDVADLTAIAADADHVRIERA